jgi:hypothetical protein
MIVFFIALAWIAVVLLCLAGGALYARVQRLEHYISAGSAREQVSHVEDLRLPIRTENVRRLRGILFVQHDCDLCHDVLPRVMSDESAARIVVVSDSPIQTVGQCLRPLTVVVDEAAAMRAGVVAFPWFMAVGDNGAIVGSYPLGDTEAITTATAYARRSV